MQPLSACAEPQSIPSHFSSRCLFLLFFTFLQLLPPESSPSGTCPSLVPFQTTGLLHCPLCTLHLTGRAEEGANLPAIHLPHMSRLLEPLQDAPGNARGQYANASCLQYKVFPEADPWPLSFPGGNFGEEWKPTKHRKAEDAFSYHHHHYHGLMHCFLVFRLTKYCFSIVI